jgi:hypothetical protein
MRTRRAAHTARVRAHAARWAARHPWIAVLVLAGAVASGAAAESPDELSRGWEPAFSVGFDVQNQGFETNVESDPLVFDSTTITYTGLGVSGSDSATVLSSNFRFDAALYTPTLFTRGGAPRFFAHAGAQVPLSEDFAILRDNQEFNRGDPRIILPGNAYCPTGELVDSKRVVTCDHSSTADMNYEISWYAGLGVELTLPIGQRRFKLRPSVDYYAQPLSIDGNVARVDRTVQNFQLGTVDGEIVRALSVSASAEELVHALGPRIVFDVEAARVGAFSLNVFLESQFYWIVSERDIFFSGQSADGTADFQVKLRPLIAQGGAGMRIVWRGD